jgi:hypothetical protein
LSLCVLIAGESGLEDRGTKPRSQSEWWKSSLSEVISLKTVGEIKFWAGPND